MLLITGASGFVGQHLLSALQAHNSAVSSDGLSYLAASGRTPVPGGICLDLRDPAQVAEIFRHHTFDGVIHLAAESRTGECQNDPQLAHEANTNATRNLLQAASTQQCWFLYVSTDMVFSGREGGYCETDSPAPLQEYGRSKALAEESVGHYPAKWCIVRPALIYGAPCGGRKSMFSWTLENLRAGTGAFYTDEIRTPIWVDDLVKLLLTLYRNRYEGVLHAGGPDRVSRYEFAQAVASEWSIPEENVVAARLDETPEFWWRPRDLSLNSAEAERFVKFTPVAAALHSIRASGSL